MKHIPYSQQGICNELSSSKQYYPKSHRIYSKNSGLCDLICNYLTINDALSSEDNITKIFNLLDVDNNKNSKANKNARFDIFEEIEDIAHSHIFKLVYFLEYPLNMVIKYYPYSVISFFQKFRIYRGNRDNINEVLGEFLTPLEIGSYIKFCSVEKKFMRPKSGHSMLIYKQDNDLFTFFDPNKGAHINLSQKELYEKCYDAFVEYKAHDFCLIDNKRLLEKRFENVDYDLNYKKLAISMVLTVALMNIAMLILLKKKKSLNLNNKQILALSFIVAGLINPLGNAINKLMGKKITPKNYPPRTIKSNAMNYAWNVLPIPFAPKWCWEVHERTKFYDGGSSKGVS